MIFKFIFILIFLVCNNVFAKTIIGKVKIIDGDTIEINSKKIRLHGIDAPEKKQNCIFDQKSWSCGKQSIEQLKKLINNQIVKCEVTDIDIYNRYVAICLVNKINLNQTMVKKGWAIAYLYFSKDYINEQRYARKNKLGIWKGKFIEPYKFRKQN